MGLFTRLSKNNKIQVPVWFMRQAGRYHSHYQKIRKNHNFIEMCKNPTLATEITLGPIDAFNFDAAILFSDILFPLEQLSMGLEYSPAPKLDLQLQTLSDLSKINCKENANTFYKFQVDALKLLKDQLPNHVTLLGFVGAPFTLYTYAVEGSHSGGLFSAKKGLYDGRFLGFMEKLMPELIKNMALQAKAGADAVCFFDTAAGELSLHDYQQFILPFNKHLTSEFKKNYPDTKIVYYSKHTHLHYLEAIQDKNIDILGIDWRIDLIEALKTLGDRYIIQGNIDPAWMHLDWKNLEKNLILFWNNLSKANIPFNRWIMGLGHGVNKDTPEENVLKSVEFIHKNFLY